MATPRVLIANRGEIAVRIIRTCRELGLPTVAVYSDVDRDALHVEMADAAFHIGPPSPAASYLSVPALLEAAKKGRASLVHPGYGFLAENAGFARAVAEAGLTFVGPSPEAMETMGDKAAARRAAERAGVPIVPGTTEPVGVQNAAGEAERIGFPIAVKASFGGGGKGMRVVATPEELAQALERAAREAGSYFGRAEVYLERYIERSHHVEAQILADTRGNVSFLGERDCSLQRRYQKLVEETPSPVVDADLRSRIGEAALALAKEAGYTNAGTVEFLVDEEGSFYFLEMNTRLQVEHPVTEMVTGVDLVALQLQVALGEKVEVEASPRGHAIECRINAEDPHHDFLPGPGRISGYREPSGPFVRTDAGVVAGKSIPREYDSLIAKLVVWGEDRERARRRMLRALSEYRIEGVPTTIPFHRWVLETPEFREGRHHTKFVEQALAESELPRFEEAPLLDATVREPAVAATIVVEVDGRRVPVRVFDPERTTAPPRPSASARSHAGHGSGDAIQSPMQGTILLVVAEEGAPIKAGDVVLILEAMKMENHVLATRDGVLTQVLVRAGQAVDANQTLAVIEDEPG
ncbi:MAG: acetyl-CoA carboxylase biotin carboxylase subunit [Actinomycetota bacterium]|nr:acetyl-CoA carboxylase biotin carboxylase subunit [Actinomycetota bacterium]